MSTHVTELVVETKAKIHTRTQFQTVKQDLNLFGGKDEWKSQRILTMERCQGVAAELQKIEEELTELKRLLIVIEYEKSQVTQEMNKTMCLIKDRP